MVTSNKISSARSFAFLSIGAAILTIALKFGAYKLTGSVSLLSDALESLVNLAAAVTALWALTVAAKPADAAHAFGYSKAEYFSSALEGILIGVAAVGIIFAAVMRIAHPLPIEQLDWGLLISLIATAINGGVAFVLLRASSRLRSIALKADAQHLLTDVWATGGILLGLMVVKFTGWLILDPIIAIAVAFHILWAGWKMLHETGLGLLDAALPAADLAIIDEILQGHQQADIQFHALRTRLAGSRLFMTVHVLVPGHWTVLDGHNLCDLIELDIARALVGTHVITHLEPAEDPLSWADSDLDRLGSPSAQE